MSRVQGSAATATTITTTTSTSAAWQRQRQQRRRHCWRESLKKCIIIKCVNSVHSKRRAVRGADFCAKLYWKNRNKLMSNCWTKKKSKRYECVKIDEPVCACVCVECVECICLLCRESKVLKSSLIVINNIHKATNTRSRGHSHW